MDANNQTWEASAPVDDAATRLAAADNEPAVHTPPSPTPTPPLLSPSSSGSHETSTSTTTPLIDSTTYYPTADPTAIDHLNATVETMWEARRAREEAERIAEQKLIDAVCAASLLEYNEKNRALETYESELAAKASERDQELERLRLRREAAEQKKRDAMQKVIDAKTRAAQLSAKVKDATKEYEAKTAERVAKELEREELAKQRAQEQSLRELAQRKDDAMRRREEAERKAQEALRKAEDMRRKAIEAAQIVRQKSRLQIEHELNAEEEARQRHAEMTLGTLEREKIAARERKEAAARKAMEAQRRAEELRLRAEQARNAARSKAASYASPQTA